MNATCNDHYFALDKYPMCPFCKINALTVALDADDRLAALSPPTPAEEKP
jgi:hypothetical protein